MEMEHDIMSFLTRMDSAVYTCDCKRRSAKKTCGIKQMEHDNYHLFDKNGLFSSSIRIYTRNFIKNIGREA